VRRSFLFASLCVPWFHFLALLSKLVLFSISFELASCIHRPYWKAASCFLLVIPNCFCYSMEWSNNGTVDRRMTQVDNHSNEHALRSNVQSHAQSFQTSSVVHHDRKSSKSECGIHLRDGFCQQTVFVTIDGNQTSSTSSIGY